MKREPFDRELKQVLREKGDPVRFSAAAEERVLSRVLNRVGEPGQKEDAEMMGRFTGRKILVAAAAICMGAAFVAVAGGKEEGTDLSEFQEFFQQLRSGKSAIYRRHILCHISDIVQHSLIFIPFFVFLGKYAFRLLDDYTRQKKAGIKSPTFSKEKMPDIANDLESW